MGPVNIDAYAFIAWCTRCTVARMAFGSLVKYQTPDPAEAEVYVFVRARVHLTMQTPFAHTYRACHRPVIRSMRAHGKASIPITQGNMNL